MIRPTTSKTHANRRVPASGDTARGNVTLGKSMPGEGDWLTGSGIIDRMLAYRDWWNLPSGSTPGGSREIRRER